MPSPLRVAALIPVFRPSCMDWFGPITYLTHAVERVHDVRGVDHVYFVATKSLTFDPAEICETCELVTVPDKVGVDEGSTFIPHASRLAELEKYEIRLILNPLCPFVKPARIEECLDLVRRNKADLAYTARRFASLELNGRNVAHQARDKLVDAVLAFRCSKLDFDAKGSWARNSRAVLVNAIEALEVSDREDNAIVTALAANGQY